MENSQLMERILNKLDDLEEAVRNSAILAAKHSTTLESIQKEMGKYSRPCQELSDHLRNHVQWRMRFAALSVGAVMSLVVGVISGIILAKLV